MSATQVAARRPSRKATLARIAAVVISMAMVSVLIIDQSRAAFTATTDNSGNAFESATIALTNDKTSALFVVPPYLVPGDVVTGCIEVTYTGTADPALVYLYQNAYSEVDGATPAVPANATLDDAMTIDIDTVDNCTTRTKLTDVNAQTIKAMAAYTSYGAGNGLSTGWNPAAAPSGESKSFLFTATFTPSGSNATDNTRIGDKVTGLTFTWETQAGT